MLQCPQQATKLGRNVKWGDAGPRLFTRVLTERGWLDRAASPALCYPIHYSEALQVLRPSRTADLAARIKPALFLHVWNSTLVHHGVDKTYVPRRDRCCACSPTGIRWMDGSANMMRSPSSVLSS